MPRATRTRSVAVRVLLGPVRPGRTRRAILPSHDIQAKLVPAIPLVVLNAKIVVSAAERGEVERGLVWLPVIDQQRAIDPHPDAVIAERAQSVLAGAEIHRARRFEREILSREIRTRGGPLVVQPRRWRGVNGCTKKGTNCAWPALLPSATLSLFPFIRASAPSHQASLPLVRQ